MRIPSPCVVILIGPAGSGKSTWAAETFRPDQVLSADAMRCLVGEGQHDLAATQDAFELLDRALDARLRRGLTTVIDTLGLDATRRLRWLNAARERGIPCHAVVFDTPPDVCRARNRARLQPVPAKAVSQQLAAFRRALSAVASEDFAAVHRAGTVEVSRPELVDAPKLAAKQRASALGLRFGLQLPGFTWSGGKEATAARLRTIAQAAEAAGFSSLWVMDHFIQIPQMGRPWEDMLESWTTLAYLAAVTTTIQLGTLVSGITYRNVAHLAKIVATLDVLSGGRAVCGLGAAWYEREHVAYGWPFPSRSQRYALLEDALQLLPLMWGPGSPSFEGKVLTVKEAVCYPRPIREHIPILVGGAGERQTLRLAATYADACNLFGSPEVVASKVRVLHSHCATVGRSPEDVTVTHLSSVLAGPDRAGVDRLVDRLRPPNVSPDAYASRVNAGTVEDQVGRFRALLENGVQTAIVSMPNVAEDDAIPNFAPVIGQFAV